MEPESDGTLAYIAGYTSGGAPYGITWTWEEQEEIECRAAAKKSATPPEQKEPVSLNDIVQGDANRFRHDDRLFPAEYR